MQNKNENLISVIVPVYNGEKYIKRCCESLLNQTYSKIEIIFVLNGCSDNSEHICEEYCSNFQNVFCFTSEKGVSVARNLGISKVNGEWFTFVDVDDWVEPTFCEVLLNNAIISGASVSACSIQRDYSFSLKASELNNIEVFSSPNLCIHNYICGGVNSMHGMVWNKIYKTSLYKDIKFDESLRINEDCLYTFCIMERCTKACLTNAKLYHWFQRDDSACHTSPRELNFDAPNVFLTLQEKTEYLKDSEIEIKLACNYFTNVVNILYKSRSYSKTKDALVALHNCRKWKKIVWKWLSDSVKIKYLIANLKCPNSFLLMKKYDIF